MEQLVPPMPEAPSMEMPAATSIPTRRRKPARSAAWSLLPKNQLETARTIRRHAERESTFLGYRRLMWTLAGMYMSGMRRFDVFDPATESIQAFYLDQEGRMEFQSQELLAVLDRAVARITSTDVRPRIERQGTSLSLIRDRATAQLVLDGMVDEDQLEGEHAKFSHLFASLGSCGVAIHTYKSPRGIRCEAECIHPREVMPFPSVGHDPTKVRGTVRQRMMTLERLKETFGGHIVSKAALEDMEAYDVPYGTSEADVRPRTGGIHYSDERSIGNSNGPNGHDEMTLVRIREVWLHGEGDRCVRYVVASGDKVLHDESFDHLDYWCPIGFASCIPGPTFHGLGYFEMLFPIARESERLQKALFQNARDLERYPVVVLPNGVFNERTMMRDVGKGLRAVNYSPDPTGEEFRPFVVQPFTTGDMPGRVAQMAREIMRDISPVQDLAREKGRVDSAMALQFLDEQMREAMTNATNGVKHAYARAWRATCASGLRELMLEEDAYLPVSTMTPDLAGAVIDMRSGTMQVSRNPIPNLASLKFNIRSTSPKSEVARKQEAIELLKLGYHDQVAIRLLSLRDGLDFATWDDEDRAAYEQVVRNILSLYGNGEEPGQVILTPYTCVPEFQLRVLGAFMGGPHMEVASPNVVAAFKQYRDTLIQFAGMTLPNAVPNPDDLAAFQSPQAGPTPNGGPQNGPGNPQQQPGGNPAAGPDPAPAGPGRPAPAKPGRPGPGGGAGPKRG